MNAYSKTLLFWSPRVLTIGYALFLGLFALDVFREGQGVTKALLALAIHLVPVYIVLTVLVIASRWEWIGAAAFATLAVWYAKGNLRHHPSWVAAIAAPLLLIALLFLANWLKHDELRARP